MESQQEDARERSASQATSADSDYSPPPSSAGDPDSRRSSVSTLTVGELRKYVLEERKSHEEERKSHEEERRRLNQLLDRSEEARRRAEEALRARCCTVM